MVLRMNYYNFSESIRMLKSKLDSGINSKIDKDYSFKLEQIDNINLNGRDIPKFLKIIIYINNNELEKIKFEYLGNVGDVVMYESEKREYYDVSQQVLMYL